MDMHKQAKGNQHIINQYVKENVKWNAEEFEMAIPFNDINNLRKGSKTVHALQGPKYYLLSNDIEWERMKQSGYSMATYIHFNFLVWAFKSVQEVENKYAQLGELIKIIDEKVNFHPVKWKPLTNLAKIVTSTLQSEFKQRTTCHQKRTKYSMYTFFIHSVYDN